MGNTIGVFSNFIHRSLDMQRSLEMERSLVDVNMTIDGLDIDVKARECESGQFTLGNMACCELNDDGTAGCCSMAIMGTYEYETCNTWMWSQSDSEDLETAIENGDACVMCISTFNGVEMDMCAFKNVEFGVGGSGVVAVDDVMPFCE